MWGRGLERAMALTLLSAGFQSLPLLPTIKLGPSGAFLSALACAHSRPLWVSPMNAPVRLGVSPQPPWVFSIRGLRLYFPMLEPWVVQSVLLPCCSSVLSMSECGAAGSARHHLVGSASCSLACPAPQFATSLGPPAAASPP